MKRSILLIDKKKTKKKKEYTSTLLPNDCLLVIFELCHDEVLLFTLPLVCKLWRSMVSDLHLWKCRLFSTCPMATHLFINSGECVDWKSLYLKHVKVIPQPNTVVQTLSDKLKQLNQMDEVQFLQEFNSFKVMVCAVPIDQLNSKLKQQEYYKEQRVKYKKIIENCCSEDQMIRKKANIDRILLELIWCRDNKKYTNNVPALLCYYLESYCNGYISLKVLVEKYYKVRMRLIVNEFRTIDPIYHKYHIFHKILELMDAGTDETIMKKVKYCLQLLNQMNSTSFNKLYAIVYLMNAKQLFNQERDQEVLDCCNTGISYDGQYSKFYYYKGKTLFILDNIEDAISEFSTGIDIDANSHCLYYGRALCYKELRLFNSALADLESAFQLNYPHKDRIYLQKGLIEYQLGNYQKACSTFSLGIAQNPCSIIYYSRSECFQRMGKMNLAIEDAIIAAKKAPNDPLFAERVVQLRKLNN
jgi:tetratricopeptide (TPR) repeat protein